MSPDACLPFAVAVVGEAGGGLRTRAVAPGEAKIPDETSFATGDAVGDDGGRLALTGGVDGSRTIGVETPSCLPFATAVVEEASGSEGPGRTAGVVDTGLTTRAALTRLELAKAGLD